MSRCYIQHTFNNHLYTYVDFRVEFSNLTYSGTESLGVISVSINLLGGTANESLYVNISTLPGSALGIVHCTVSSYVAMVYCI